MIDAPVLAVTRADYADPDDAAAIITLLNAYACDPMGGRMPLTREVMETVVPGMAATGHAFSLLARVDDVPVGLANCFRGYSTFVARPLVNVHDVFVAAEHRGTGVARALFAEIERIARAEDASKVTLEVLSGNDRARALYTSLGYGDYALDPETGAAMFWQKRLD